MVSKLSEIWSGLFIPDPDHGSWFFTHPWSRIQRSKRHRISGSRIRNTAVRYTIRWTNNIKGQGCAIPVLGAQRSKVYFYKAFKEGYARCGTILHVRHKRTFRQITEYKVISPRNRLYENISNHTVGTVSSVTIVKKEIKSLTWGWPGSRDFRSVIWAEYWKIK